MKAQNSSLQAGSKKYTSRFKTSMNPVSIFNKTPFAYHDQDNTVLQCFGEPVLVKDQQLDRQLFDKGHHELAQQSRPDIGDEMSHRQAISGLALFMQPGV